MGRRLSNLAKEADPATKTDGSQWDGVKGDGSGFLWKQSEENGEGVVTAPDAAEKLDEDWGFYIGYVKVAQMVKNLPTLRETQVRIP